jgi:hypothetical protein
MNASDDLNANEIVFRLQTITFKIDELNDLLASGQSNDKQRKNELFKEYMNEIEHAIESNLLDESLYRLIHEQSLNKFNIDSNELLFDEKSELL